MLTVISSNWVPGEAASTDLDRSWRKLQVILRRGRPIPNIFRAKTHVNVLKGTFSTDRKSNCIRIDRAVYPFLQIHSKPHHGVYSNSRTNATNSSIRTKSIFARKSHQRFMYRMTAPAPADLAPPIGLGL